MMRIIIFCVLYIVFFIVFWVAGFSILKRIHEEKWKGSMGDIVLIVILLGSICAMIGCIKSIIQMLA